MRSKVKKQAVDIVPSLVLIHRGNSYELKKTAQHCKILCSYLSDYRLKGVISTMEELNAEEYNSFI